MPAPHWLNLKIALMPSTSEIAPVFAIVWPLMPFGCPVLGERLAQIIREMLPGLPHILLYRDGSGDWRTYGDKELVLDALKVDLDHLHWVDLCAH